MSKNHFMCNDEKWLIETRRYCKCGHSMHFYKYEPYIRCTHCGKLVFRDKKAEYDYMIKRRFKR